MDSHSWSVILDALPIIMAIVGVLLNSLVHARLKKMLKRPRTAEAVERKGEDLPYLLKSSPGISYYVLITSAVCVVAIPIICARENLYTWIMMFFFGFWGGATIDCICES